MSSALVEDTESLTGPVAPPASLAVDGDSPQFFVVSDISVLFVRTLKSAFVCSCRSFKASRALLAAEALAAAPARAPPTRHSHNKVSFPLETLANLVPKGLTLPIILSLGFDEGVIASSKCLQAEGGNSKRNIVSLWRKGCLLLHQQSSSPHDRTLNMLPGLHGSHSSSCTASLGSFSRAARSARSASQPQVRVKKGGELSASSASWMCGLYSAAGGLAFLPARPATVPEAKKGDARISFKTSKCFC